MNHNYYVYIMANRYHTVLYTGVTNDLLSRVCAHRNGIDKSSFTYRYNVHKLVYYEHHTFIDLAIVREKQIKSGSRKKKTELIQSMNPEWNDLYETL